METDEPKSDPGLAMAEDGDGGGGADETLSGAGSEDSGSIDQALNRVSIALDDLIQEMTEDENKGEDTLQRQAALIYIQNEIEEFLAPSTSDTNCDRARIQMQWFIEKALAAPTRRARLVYRHTITALLTHLGTTLAALEDAPELDLTTMTT